MRNEYVSTILHTALHIAGDVTGKEFSMRPEYEIIGDENSGRVDYAIKVTFVTIGYIFFFCFSLALTYH